MSRRVQRATQFSGSVLARTTTRTLAHSTVTGPMALVTRPGTTRPVLILKIPKKRAA